jgi:streptomycin 6-kinase
MIVPVRRAGDAAVLKVSYRHPGNVHEPIALEAWQGNGAVRLLERADESYAMLLERAHDETLASLANVEDLLTTAGALNARLTSSSATSAPPISDQADAWALELQQDVQDFRGALPARVTDQAAATVRDLGSHQRGFLIHGDFHPGNILPADREPWLAIDPKGYSGDPGYDAAVMMRWRLGSLLSEDAEPDAAVRRALRIYCEAAGVDLESGRLWTQLIAVQASYWGRRHGFETARSGVVRDRVVALADLVAASFCG